jgi:hypothetical protein
MPLDLVKFAVAELGVLEQDIVRGSDFPDVMEQPAELERLDVLVLESDRAPELVCVIRDPVGMPPVYSSLASTTFRSASIVSRYRRFSST